jgi:hypothetical protein
MSIHVAGCDFLEGLFSASALTAMKSDGETDCDRAGESRKCPIRWKIQEQHAAVIAENGRWLPLLDKQKA